MSELDVYGMARDPRWATETVFGSGIAKALVWQILDDSPDTVDNLRVLCRSCNSRKRDRIEVAP